MVKKKLAFSASKLRLGFVPLVDIGPIAVAHEYGIFKRYDLDVQLSRELGWASVRDKIYYGDLDASQAIAGLSFSLALSFNDLRSDVSATMIINSQGNAITLSKSISPEIIQTPHGLEHHLKYHWKKNRPFTLAVTHRYSSHHILIHLWLKRQGIKPNDDVEIIFLPPHLMHRQLKVGHIDGYCVGEPWNSEAILNGDGWSPASSIDLSHTHPEKVLLVTNHLLIHRQEEAIRLTAAILEACSMCQDKSFRPELIHLLSKKQYIGSSKAVLENSLGSTFDNGITKQSADFFHLFYGNDVNRPSMDKASWTLAGLRNIGVVPDSIKGSLSKIYREDLYQIAMNMKLQHESVS